MGSTLPSRSTIDLLNYNGTVSVGLVVGRGKYLLISLAYEACKNERSDKKSYFYSFIISCGNSWWSCNYLLFNWCHVFDS